MRSSCKNILAIAFALSFSACRQKEVFCEEPIYEIPAFIAFKGFAPSEVDTVLVRHYIAGSNYTHLKKTDTVVSTAPFQSGDTTYHSLGPSRIGFVQISRWWEYEVIIPDLSLTYRIDNLHYSGDSVMRWTTDGRCSQGGFTKTADTVRIDNANVPLSTSDHHNWVFAYLVK